METSQPEWREERRDSAGLIKPDTERSSFMSILQNYCEPRPIAAREQRDEGTEGTEAARVSWATEDTPLPSYDSIFSKESQAAGSRSSFKPPQRYSWDEQAEQLKQQRRANFEEDAHGNLVPKIAKKATAATSHVTQFEQLKKTVSTEETERARARRAAKADAARKEAEARAMRHSGDYRVKHVKSATTPAKTGVKTLVQNKEISPFHSLMENLRKGFAGQP